MGDVIKWPGDRVEPPLPALNRREQMAFDLCADALLVLNEAQQDRVMACLNDLMAPCQDLTGVVWSLPSTQ